MLAAKITAIVMLPTGITPRALTVSFTPCRRKWIRSRTTEEVRFRLGVSVVPKLLSYSVAEIPWGWLSSVHRQLTKKVKKRSLKWKKKTPNWRKNYLKILSFSLFVYKRTEIFFAVPEDLSLLQFSTKYNFLMTGKYAKSFFFIYSGRKIGVLVKCGGLPDFR